LEILTKLRVGWGGRSKWNFR